MEVYIHALSPTGRVMVKLSFVEPPQLKPSIPADPRDWNSFAPLPLNLLRASKQIYSEARDVIYRHNAISFFCPRLFLWQIKEIPTQYLDRIQHVWIRLTLTEDEDHLHLGEALRSLCKWVDQGTQLRTITLSIAPDPVELRELLLQYQESDGPGERLARYIKVLRESWSKTVPFRCNVIQKLEIIPPWATRTSRGTKDGDMVKVLHEAFGGEFWVGGKLFFQDGKELVWLPERSENLDLALVESFQTALHLR